MQPVATSRSNARCWRLHYTRAMSEHVHQLWYTRSREQSQLILTECSGPALSCDQPVMLELSIARSVGPLKASDHPAMHGECPAVCGRSLSSLHEPAMLTMYSLIKPGRQRQLKASHRPESSVSLGKDILDSVLEACSGMSAHLAPAMLMRCPCLRVWCHWQALTKP